MKRVNIWSPSERPDDPQIQIERENSGIYVNGIPDNEELLYALKDRRDTPRYFVVVKVDGSEQSPETPSSTDPKYKLFRGDESKLSELMVRHATDNNGESFDLLCTDSGKIGELHIYTAEGGEPKAHSPRKMRAFYAVSDVPGGVVVSCESLDFLFSKFGFVETAEDLPKPKSVRYE